MYAVADYPPMASAPDHEPVFCVAPHDADRLAAMVGYVAQRLKPKHLPLSKLYIVKLHPLVDLFALQHTGQPIIGGDLKAWDLGPVTPRTYRKVDAAIEAYKAGLPIPLGLDVRHHSRDKYDISAAEAVDEEDYSPLETKAMQFAWNEIGSLGYKELDKYTHDTAYPMGRAWLASGGKNGGPIDWLRLLFEYDQRDQTDHYERMRDYIASSPWRCEPEDAGPPDVEVDDLGHPAPI